MYLHRAISYKVEEIEDELYHSVPASPSFSLTNLIFGSSGVSTGIKSNIPAQMHTCKATVINPRPHFA